MIWNKETFYPLFRDAAAGKFALTIVYEGLLDGRNAKDEKVASSKTHKYPIQD